ncbi:MAG TPA: AraC family transcriptional regulator [Spirochaetota bacterium]|nr:AraC family transcriptional regulator [Spirochaetota bacterium]HPC43348.1 AraC family transcriptional regulator [Spirochaetota bacterium]HPL16242.1 AraC family transcriptional regulator [Spirochaetota bacterium]HQF08417.1 AraC family transcriptional regulator [Spirochaetota bacterium]HQH99054.1 AraC family transcriptional regulator [Spirochaetota bacterium]
MFDNLLMKIPVPGDEPAADRNRRRRGIIVKDTLYVYSAYTISILITVLARYIELTAVSFAALAWLFLWVTIVTVVFAAIARARDTVTPRFARSHYTGQFIVWLATYAVWTYQIGTIRSAGLLFALMAMAFLLPNSNLFESYLLAASIAVVQASVSVYALLYANQPGSLVKELLYILCFFTAAIFISFLAGEYDRQREKIRQARVQAAAARDVIWKVIRKTADGGGDTLHDALYMVNLVFEYCGAEGGCLFVLDQEHRQLDLVFSKLEKDSVDLDDVERTAALAMGLKGHDRQDGGTDEAAEDPAQNIDAPFCIVFEANRGSAGVCCLIQPAMIGEIPDREMAVIREILSRSADVLSHSPLHGGPSGNGREEKTVLTASAVEKIEKAVAYIRENFTSDISRDGLASHLDISPNYFGKLFAEYTGKKMNDYIIDLRIDEAVKLLRDTDRQVIDIAFEVGFNNLRTFNRAFSKNLSMTPQEYRKSERN